MYRLNSSTNFVHARQLNPNEEDALQAIREAPAKTVAPIRSKNLFVGTYGIDLPKKLVLVKF